MLPLLEAYFRLSPSQVSFIPTVTQFGYAAGLLAFVPLGDRISRKRLILSLLAANTLCLLFSGLAPQFWVLGVASYVVGLTSVTAQIIIPMTVAISSPMQRGKVVGVLLSGLSSGVLLARTLSGLVSAHSGWRAMYFLAAALDVGLFSFIALRMPDSAGEATVKYGELLRSLWHLFLAEPLLRLSALTGALCFAAYSGFWSALAFLLARPPYGFGSDIAGLFGLVALLGIAASASIGGWSDRRGQRTVWTIGASFFLLAFAALWWGGSSILVVCSGTVFLDLGNRASLITNQSRIYALRPEARSRLNTVFMVSYFTGGALGSSLGSFAAQRGGWHGLAIFGVVLPLTAMVVHALYRVPSSVR
jgi:predicted MFS family arabinose efflux permease